MTAILPNTPPKTLPNKTPIALSRYIFRRAAIAVATLVLVSSAASCKKSQTQSSVQDTWAPAPGKSLTPAPATSAYSTPTGNTKNHNFGTAKKNLATIHQDHRKTLLCDCAFDESGTIDKSSCGLASGTGTDNTSTDNTSTDNTGSGNTGDNKRSQQIDWELIVPYRVFGPSFEEWSDGHEDCVDSKGKPFRGRDCVRKASVAYRLIEADMYNIQPVVRSVIDKRNGAPFAMLVGDTHAFGSCDLEITIAGARPRVAVRGDIARTYMYMDEAYPGHGIISGNYKVQFEVWSKHDPVDRWECERARRIAAIQGNVNHVVEKACREAKL